MSVGKMMKKELFESLKMQQKYFDLLSKEMNSLDINLTENELNEWSKIYYANT